MEGMQGAVEQLTKGQALITEQIGLLIGAIESKQGQPIPSAPRTKPSENKWTLAWDADEGPSDAQKQKEQIEYARKLAKCTSSLQGFNSNSMPISNRNGGIRAAIADVREIAIAGEMGDLLLPPAGSLQALATQTVCEQGSCNMGMCEFDALTYGMRVSTGSLTEAGARSPLHPAVTRHVSVGNTMLGIRLNELARLGSGPGYQLLNQTLGHIGMEVQAVISCSILELDFSQRCLTQ